MRYIILPILFLFAFEAYASEIQIWRDLELGRKYILNMDIPISEGQVLKKEGAYQLVDIFSGYAPVLNFTFKDLLCTNTKLTSEMVLFNPEPNNHDQDKSIGVQLVENCYVEVFVEPKYYYDNSVFSAP